MKARKLRLQEAKIKAEQKRIACSKRGSSVAASRQSGARLRRGSGISRGRLGGAEPFVEPLLKSPRKEKSILPTNTVILRKNVADGITKNRTKQWINDLNTRRLPTELLIIKLKILYLNLLSLLLYWGLIKLSPLCISIRSVRGETIFNLGGIWPGC